MKTITNATEGKRPIHLSSLIATLRVISEPLTTDSLILMSIQLGLTWLKRVVAPLSVAVHKW